MDKTDHKHQIEAYEALIELREMAIREIRTPGSPDDLLCDLVEDIQWAKKKLEAMNGSRYFKDPAQYAENALDQMLPGRFESQMQRLEYTIANTPLQSKQHTCPNCRTEIQTLHDHCRCPICFTQID